MRIGKRESDEKKPRLKPPPDYFSRGMQWRLLIMVSLLMVVLTLAFEAGNPSRWKWFEKLDHLADKKRDTDIDPRIKEPDPTSISSNEVVIDPRTRPKVIESEPMESNAVSAVDRAWVTGWEDVFAKLSFHDRRLIYRLLQAAREKTQLEASDLPSAQEAVTHLDQRWTDYRAIAKSGVQELTEEEQSAWKPVIEQLKTRWTNEIKPQLVALSEGRDISSDQRTALVGLQDLLDRLELNAVQDNTPFRASEREIWFRLLGKLQSRTSEELEREADGPIGYGQLFKQSSAYRGKIVTVRGTAEAVYWVDAPPNSYAIKRYWVYWLRPEGGPNSPILVYALEKPANFPYFDIADLGRKKLASVEDLEVTGFFFKRYAYQGQGGIFTTPMLLAKGPKWISAESSHAELPSLTTALSVAAGMALFAAAFAAWVYYQHSSTRAHDSDLPERLFARSQER